MTWVLWAVVLMLQNAAFTWVSRARNSGSVKWHGIASIFSNGTWVLVQAFLISRLWQAFDQDNLLRTLGIAIFYTVFTTIGAVVTHHYLLWFEKGDRRVGARIT